MIYSLAICFFKEKKLAEDIKIHSNITFQPAATLSIIGFYHSGPTEHFANKLHRLPEFDESNFPTSKVRLTNQTSASSYPRKRTDEKQQTDKVTLQNRCLPPSALPTGNKRFRWKSCVRGRLVSAAYSGDDHMLSNTASARLNKSLK